MNNTFFGLLCSALYSDKIKDVLMINIIEHNHA